jgi:hypothetical protein
VLQLRLQLLCSGTGIDLEHQLQQTIVQLLTNDMLLLNLGTTTWTVTDAGGNTATTANRYR